MRNQWVYYLEHKEEIDKEYRIVAQGKIITKDLCTCICGSKIRINALKKHLCSIKHINFTASAAQNKTVD